MTKDKNFETNYNKRKVKQAALEVVESSGNLINLFASESFKRNFSNMTTIQSILKGES